METQPSLNLNLTDEQRLPGVMYRDSNGRIHVNAEDFAPDYPEPQEPRPSSIVKGLRVELPASTLGLLRTVADEKGITLIQALGDAISLDS